MMSVTINFNPTGDTDVIRVNVYESDSSDGDFVLVYYDAIDENSSFVTYADGDEAKWYKISFVNTVGGESALSKALYGGGVDWADYMMPIARTEIDDWVTPYRISDEDMRKRLVVYASKLQMEMIMQGIDFNHKYTFIINNSNGSSWDITPDPVYSSPDNDFISLWTLVFACANVSSGLTKAASNAIKIKDGSSSIDTSAGFGGYRALFESEGGPCSELKRQKTAFIFGKKQGNHTVFGNFAHDNYPLDIYIRKDRSR